jgi:hypothetical protein
MTSSSMVSNGEALIRKVLLVVPTNTVTNWEHGKWTKGFSAQAFLRVELTAVTDV